MKKWLSKRYGKFLSFCLRNRLGKNDIEARIIFFILKSLQRFTFYENTYTKESRGHYVPQFILRNFKITNDQSKLGCVNVFSKKEKSISSSSIKEAAQLTDFYVFRDRSGNKSDFTERKLYGATEISMSKVVKYLLKINKTEKFTLLESSIVAGYMALQITRTPFFRESLIKFLSFLIVERNYNFRNLFIGDNDLNYKEIDRVIIFNSFNVTQFELDNFTQDMVMEGKDSQVLLQLISNIIASNIGRVIHNKNLSILDITNSNFKLVISDNPIVFLENGNGWWNFPAWWDLSNKDLIMAMPLTPEKAILLNPNTRKDGKNYLNDTPAQFIFGEMINAYQFGGCLDYVFSDDENYLENQAKYYSTVIDHSFESFKKVT